MVDSLNIIHGTIVDTGFGYRHESTGEKYLKIEFRLESGWYCMMYFKGEKIEIIRKIFDITDYDQLCGRECLLIDHEHITGVPYGFKPLSHNNGRIDYVMNDNLDLEVLNRILERK